VHGHHLAVVLAFDPALEDVDHLQADVVIVPLRHYLRIARRDQPDDVRLQAGRWWALLMPRSRYWRSPQAVGPEVSARKWLTFELSASHAFRLCFGFSGFTAEATLPFLPDVFSRLRLQLLPLSSPWAEFLVDLTLSRPNFCGRKLDEIGTGNWAWPGGRLHHRLRDFRDVSAFELPGFHRRHHGRMIAGGADIGIRPSPARSSCLMRALQIDSQPRA